MIIVFTPPDDPNLDISQTYYAFQVYNESKIYFGDNRDECIFFTSEKSFRKHFPKAPQFSDKFDSAMWYR